MDPVRQDLAGRLYAYPRKLPAHAIPRMFAILICLAGCLQGQAQAGKSDGGQPTVTLDMKNVKVQKVLKEVSRQTRTSIVYQESIFENWPTITIQVKDAKMDEVLNKCLGKGFTRRTEGNVITIRKSGPAANEEEGVGSGPLSGGMLKGLALDTEGKPVEGASIAVRGPSRKSAIANSKGEFTVNSVLRPGPYTLTASSVGYKDQEKRITIGREDISINFILEKSWNESKEVIVNGLYSRPKENFTGAATVFTGEELRQVNPKSVLEALKSLDASIQMPADNVQGSNPNIVPRLQVRGTNSIMQTDLKSEYGYISNPPLIVIDGFESTLQALFDMDINRVAKVTILKDAAATAIYGSKSANGVIVVQTIQPKSGETQVNYTFNLSANMPDLSSFNLMNAREKFKVENIGGLYRSRAYTDQQRLNDQYNLALHNIQRGVNTYWLSQPLQTELQHAHTLSISAGTQRLVYMATFSYRNNGGIMKGSGRDNLEGILNVHYTSNDKKFSLQGQFSINTVTGRNTPYGDFGEYAKMNPYWMAKDVNGKVTRYADAYPTDGDNSLYSANYHASVINPLYNSTVNIVDKTKSLGLGQNIYLDYSITHALKLTSTFSYSTNRTQSDIFMPGSASQFFNTNDFTEKGSYNQNTGTLSSYQSNTTINYGKNIGRHTVFATGGVSLQQNSDNNLQISVKGFPSDRLNDLLYGLTYASSKPSGTYNLNRTAGFLGNTSYAYDNRYLLDLSLRSDGSSVFGARKRFGELWSTGVGWNLHNEHFIHLPKVINRLKLTGTFGFTGSVNFPSYAAVTTYKYNTTGRYLDFVPANIIAVGNPDLLWQRTKKFNAAADISLFNNRLNLVFNIFKETTDDLIMSNQSAPSTGFGQFFNNLGKSQNTGYELSFTAFLLKNPAQKLYWSISSSFYHNHNKLLKITDALEAQNKAALALQTQGYNKPVLQYQEGASVSTLYAVRSLGIDPANGYEIFLTKDGKQTYTWSQADAVAMGDMQPKLDITMNNNFQYKWLRLNFAIRIQTGGVLYNSTLADKVENTDLKYNVDRRSLKDRWQTPGVPASFKGLTDLEGYTRVGDPTAVTSRFVQRANTIEITGINLDPGALLERAITKYTNLLINKLNNKTDQVLKSNMLNVRFYMNNAFTISSLKRERGTSYPFNRTYTMNISLHF